MKLLGRSKHKSLAVSDVTGFELPQFTVLTGRNGAGKSNLLQALNQNSVVVEELGELYAPQVRLFSLGELLAAAEGPATGAQYKDGWSVAFNHLQGMKTNLPSNFGPDPDAQEAGAVGALLSSRMLSQLAITRMVDAVGKRLIEMSMEEFRDHAPLLGGIKDPFAASVTEIFLSYSNRRWANDVRRFRDSQNGQTTAMTDAAFAAKFGNAPWELLNDTLKIVSLPYRFPAPPEDVENANYEARLTNDDDVIISTGDLSSGERVLLAVAMSLFTGTNLGEAIELPKLLMLDEADASLHPSMVRSLLTVVEEIFVKQYGVMVIMATHSPTTVALAPEESLHVMSRSAPKLLKTTTDEALKILTVGISSLSVKIENRRQVFVESEYDQAIYQELFGSVKSKLTSDKSIEFIAAGRRGVSGGCAAVNNLVTELRAAGVDTVYGIVDRDNRTDAPANVYYVPDRYSIENILFDPALLATFLIREQVLKSDELGLPGGKRSFELSGQDIQIAIPVVCSKLGLELVPTRKVVYAGGFAADVPESILDLQGHALEDLIIDTFPGLNSFRQKLKAQVAKRAVGDKPEFLPQVVLDLFERFT